ncbi:MAG: IS630 family transposase, partial [Gallionella sp.]
SCLGEAVLYNGIIGSSIESDPIDPMPLIPLILSSSLTPLILPLISDPLISIDLSWMIIDEAFNSDKLIEFLEALIKDAEKKVFLILDNLRVHHSKPVKKWAGEHKDEIELFYLPSYSPELNPEERLNADLKHAIYTKVPVRTKAKLRAATTEHMQALEKSPERVKKFFQDSRVKYAA